MRLPVMLGPRTGARRAVPHRMRGSGAIPERTARARVRHILDAATLQPKLTVGPSDDVYEQEADRVAGEVMPMPEAPARDGTVQRVCAECEEELAQRQAVGDAEKDDEQVQAKRPLGGVPNVGTEVEAGIASLRGSGTPLSAATRNFFEPRFARDFREVRVHTDAPAAATARAIDARAYTLGNDVVFAGGEYAPGTAAGRRLLAHELVHVVQQRGSVGAAHDTGPVRRKPPTAATPDPVSEAVKILKASGKLSTGTSALSDALVRGIVKAESAVMGIGGAIAEFLGIGDTRGPGQIGEPAVQRVNKSFGTEKAAFASMFGPAPTDWEDAVTDTSWAHFYIAGYLAARIDEAKGVFQVSDADSTINFGIGLYHGAFHTIRDYRRALAKKLGIADLKKITWKMLLAEVEKSEVVVFGAYSAYIPKIVSIVEYVHIARGWPLPKVRIIMAPMPGP